MKNDSVTKISLVLIPEAMGSTLLSVYDVFNGFAEVVPGGKPFDVSIVSDTTEPVKTASGIYLSAQQTYADIDGAHVIVVPALMVPPTGWVPGRYPALMQWLCEQYRRGAMLCSTCSGIFALMETGLFDSVPVTCHWYYADELKKTYPHANLRIDKTLLLTGDDDRLIMSGASSSWHDLVLYLMNRFSGPAATTAVAKFFLLSWHPEGQTPYARFREDTSHGDAIITQVQAWIGAHWMEANAIEQMVRLSGLPERSFKRRFRNATGRTPMDYIQRLRIENAKQFLENSELPVDEIAAEIGYEDPAFFRKLFKRITTMTPSAYRMKFRAPRVVSA